MRVDLTTLRLFLSVVEEQSIAGAAQRENIAASALSKRIHDLEIEVGTPLLNRHRRGVVLTAAGTVLLQHARSMLSLVDRMRGELSEHARGMRGVVEMVANTSSIVEYLPEALASFAERCPGVRVKLRERTSSAAASDVRDGIADIGLVAAVDSEEGLEFLDFRTDRLAVVAAADHPLAEFAEVGFADALRYPYIGFLPSTSLQMQIDRWATSQNRRIEPVVQAISFDAIRRFAQAGMGIGIVPEGCIRPYEFGMHIRAIPLTDDWALRTLRICARSFDDLPMAVRLLVQHLCRS